MSSSDNLTDKEKAVLETLTKGKDTVKDEDKENLVPIKSTNTISSDTVCLMLNNLFDKLGDMVNPCWKLQNDESKSIAETMKVAYPEVDLEKYAKLFFWINLTFILAPRAYITLKDLAKKRQGASPNELNSNNGTQG